jgi:hypothetical protein
MSSSEAVSAGALVFSFTLHSCFIGITGPMALKSASLSFLAASSLSFCALTHWFLFLWLGVSPRGHQRVVGTVLGTIVFEAPLLH